MQIQVTRPLGVWAYSPNHGRRLPMACGAIFEVAAQDAEKSKMWLDSEMVQRLDKAAPDKAAPDKRAPVKDGPDKPPKAKE